jgi:hypothetical protein
MDQANNDLISWSMWRRYRTRKRRKQKQRNIDLMVREGLARDEMTDAVNE